MRTRLLRVVGAGGARQPDDLVGRLEAAVGGAGHSTAGIPVA
ncbi:hypothetical protein ABZ464_44515 [Streptomyces sp. NPDC005820]